jgi:hypothetical protein
LKNGSSPMDLDHSSFIIFSTALLYLSKHSPITYYTSADSTSGTLSLEIVAQNLSSVCYVDWEAQTRSALPATRRRVIDDGPEEPDFLDRFD